MSILGREGKLRQTQTHRRQRGPMRVRCTDRSRQANRQSHRKVEANQRD